MADQIIDVPGQGKVAFPAGMSDADIVKAIQANSPKKLNDNPVANFVGMQAEPLLNMATSMVAKPASEVAGLAAVVKNLLTGKRDDVEGFKREFQDKMTYSPRTRAGDAIVRSPFNPVNILSNVVGGASDLQHSIVGGGSADSSPRGMIANALREAGVQAIGFAGVKGAPAVVDDIATAGRTVTAPVRHVGNMARSVLGPESGRAGRMLSDVAGVKRDAVISAMESAKTHLPGEQLTAGMAAVNAASPEFVALQEIIANRNPGKYKSGGIQAANEAARQAELARHAGTPDALARLEAVRDGQTGPMRETAFANADLANNTAPGLQSRLTAQQEAIVNALQDKGRYQTMAAQQEWLERGGQIDLARRQPTNEPYFNVGATGGRSPATVTPDGSLPRNVPFRFDGSLPPSRNTSNFTRSLEAAEAVKDIAGIEAARKAQADLTKYQLDSLAAHGHYPLKVQPLIEQLNSQIASPVASTVTKKALTAIRDDILDRAKGGGEISSRALYTVRKEIGNTIKVFSKETANWDKRHTAGIEIGLQKAIDDAIAGAGGAGWTDYLKKYSELSGPIENMRSAQALQGALTDPLKAKDRPAAFARAATNETNPITSQRIQSSVDAIIESLSRDAAYNRMAKEGVSATKRIIGMDQPKVPPTGMFNPGISTARALINKFSDKATDKTMAYLANNMDNPAKIAQLMRDASPAQKKIIEAIMQQNAVRAAGAVTPYAAQGERE